MIRYTKFLLIAFIIYFNIGCVSNISNQNKKITGPWIIENIENKNPNSNLYKGALISFTKDGVFRAPRVNKDSPRTGEWKIVKKNSQFILKISSSNPFINGTYHVNAFLSDNLNPNSIKLTSINSNHENYYLSKLVTSPEDYLN